MKTFLLFAILLFTNGMYSQVNAIIIWDTSYKLSWDDFQGTSDSRHYGHAKTSYSIQIIPEEVTVDSQDRIIDYEKITVRAQFNKKKSWSTEKVNSTVLNHEQIHFDIAELYARKIRKKFDQNITSKESRYNKYWSDYQKLWNECIDFQEKFDIETNHSRNFEQSTIWINLVALELRKLREFE